MEETEEALVQRSRRGDRAAFEEIVRRTARLIYARAYLETGNRHRAEDLVQETYLIAWRKIAQLNAAGGLRAWLMAILHTAVIDAARREGRKKRRAPDEREVWAQEGMRLAQTAADPADATEQREQRERALSVLRSLPAEYRDVLTLRYLAGADYDSIARQLALSNGSLRGLLHRGMAMLRQQMKAC